MGMLSKKCRYFLNYCGPTDISRSEWSGADQWNHGRNLCVLSIIFNINYVHKKDSGFPQIARNTLRKMIQ